MRQSWEVKRMLVDQIYKAQTYETNKLVKVVVFGSDGSGKTALISCLDPGIRQVGSMHSILPTTVTFDLGVVKIDDRKIYLYGAPGDERLKVALNLLSRGMDLALIVIDAFQGVTDYDRHIISKLSSKGIPYIVIASKMDMPGSYIDRVLDGLNESCPLLPVSAKTGYGMDILTNAIMDLADDAGGCHV